MGEWTGRTGQEGLVWQTGRTDELPLINAPFTLTKIHKIVICRLPDSFIHFQQSMTIATMIISFHFNRRILPATSIDSGVEYRQVTLGVGPAEIYRL